MRWVLFDIVTLEFKNPVRIVYQSFTSRNFLICKLVHTSRDKSVVEVVTWLIEDWYKKWEKVISF